MSPKRGSAPTRPPSVDSLARELAETFDLPHPLLVDAARRAIAEGAADAATIRELAHKIAHQIQTGLLQPAINATGVLLHTNLGRAPWPLSQPSGYTNLEFDLTTGQRGSRQTAVGELLAKLCGAERAHVVNNGAAAVLLVLASLAAGRGVAVSRGELVEIGGGFRVPEVMSQSGARLVEVGTTNRTRPDDFAQALARPSADIALCLKVHQSNYTIEGFTQSVSLLELAEVARGSQPPDLSSPPQPAPPPPVVFDLGSGLLDASCFWLPDGPPDWLANEPAVRQSLEAGADLVIFSGDKLLGGPQAGIICGRAELVERCAQHPLARALRPGVHIMSGLQQVALAYLERDLSRLPFWRLATTPTHELARRIEAVGLGPPVEMASVPGGGTLPGVEIPSVGIRLEGDLTQPLRDRTSPDRTSSNRTPPVIARVFEGHTYLDWRTVLPDQDEQLAAAVRACAGSPAGAQNRSGAGSPTRGA